MFTPLEPRSYRRSRHPGCLLALGGPLIAVGIWLVAMALLVRPEAEAARIQVIAGAALAVTGLALLIARMRTTMDAALRPVEVALPEGTRLTPGAEVPLQIRQRGPARLARLRVTVVCERRFSKQERKPGSRSVTSVDEVESVWTQELLNETDVSVGLRGQHERIVTLAVPHLAQPSGPALPGGVIAWYLDVCLDTSRRAVIHDLFDITVVLSDSAATTIQPVAGAAEPAGAGGAAGTAGPGEGVGCAAISAGFVFSGAAFLFLYFSGATVRRGNPTMGLVAGIVFTGLGLLGIFVLISGRRQRHTRDPRRLP